MNDNTCDRIRGTHTSGKPAPTLEPLVRFELTTAKLRHRAETPQYRTTLHSSRRISDYSTPKRGRNPQLDHTRDRTCETPQSWRGVITDAARLFHTSDTPVLRAVPSSRPSRA